MHESVRVTSDVNLVIYAALALAMGRDWLRRHDRPTLWAALAFGSLGVVVVLSRALPEHPHGLWHIALQRLLVALLVLFPYLLYRFAMAFGQHRGRRESYVALLTAALVVATFALPHFPAADEKRAWWFDVYLVWFLLHWAALSVVVAVRLWRSGRDQPYIAQRRMRALTLASILFTITIFGAAFAAKDSVTALVVQLLAGASGITFVMALSPPAIVRFLWRRGDQARMQGALIGLVSATSVDEILGLILPRIGAAVGARSLLLRDTDGNTVGAYGSEASAESPPPTLIVPTSQGELLLWATEFAPFFGEEELRLTRTIGELALLAIDRARLFAQEREGRLALEQANRVMTNFIALAAHELRTPVTTISGSALTLRERADQLSPEQRSALEQVLAQESERLRRLIEQLLDLSRLDAAAIDIAPQDLPLRTSVEEIVTGAAGERRGEVDVAIDPKLVVTADPTALERIVGNLVANALRYGEQPVVVSAERSDNHLRLRVRDHGHGVAEEFVPDLFERFTRSKQSPAQAAGTGLGLAIARAYARAHDGDLFYETAADSGACFELVLPQS